MQKANSKTPKKLSRVDINSAVEGTWFDVREESDSIVLDSREHGDVGSETPGKLDFAEAKRMSAILRGRFPRHDIRVETVDEWVVLEISRCEKSKESLAKEKIAQLSAKAKERWKPVLAEALARSAKKCLGPNADSKNYARPFSWSNELSLGTKSCTTTFRAEYGQRHLYRDHLGAIPAFKDPGESLAHFSKFIREIGGTLKAERINPPWKKLTYNRPAPNNVIEEVGHVSYDVEIPLVPPRIPKSLSRSTTPRKSKFTQKTQFPIRESR